MVRIAGSKGSLRLDHRPRVAGGRRAGPRAHRFPDEVWVDERGWRCGVRNPSFFMAAGAGFETSDLWAMRGIRRAGCPRPLPCQGEAPRAAAPDEAELAQWPRHRVHPGPRTPTAQSADITRSHRGRLARGPPRTCLVRGLGHPRATKFPSWPRGRWFKPSPRSHEERGCSGRRSASPFRLPRLHPGIGAPWARTAPPGYPRRGDRRRSEPFDQQSGPYESGLMTDDRRTDPREATQIAGRSSATARSLDLWGPATDAPFHCACHSVGDTRTLFLGRGLGDYRGAHSLTKVGGGVPIAAGGQLIGVSPARGLLLSSQSDAALVSNPFPASGCPAGAHA